MIGPGHRALARVAPRVSLDVLLEGRGLLAQQAALAAVAPCVRAHPLTPQVTLSLVLGMALHRDASVPEAFNRVLAPFGLRDPVTDGALAHARKRLGADPLRIFFESLAAGGPRSGAWHGRRLLALDGTYVALPDTPANAKAFGRPHWEGKGRPLPAALVITLSDAITHHILAASIHPCRTGEREPGLKLLKRLGPGALVLMDRGFYSARMVLDIEALGIEYAVRMPDSVKPEIVRARGDGDADVAICTHYRRERGRRAGRRRWDSRCEELEALGRMIQYRVGHGRRRVRLLTNVGDVGALEQAEAYHLRWEAEIGYDEMKTHLAAPLHGAQDLSVRGRSPELAEQEIWALLATYNFIRDPMAEAALARRIDPRSLSFTRALNLARAASGWRLQRSRRGRARRRRLLIQMMGECRLRRWRRKRRCPRAVRGRWNPYPGKKPHQHAAPDSYKVALVALGA